MLILRVKPLAKRHRVRTVKVAGFQFRGSANISSKEWPEHLPLDDHKSQKRFQAAPISDMIVKVNAFVAQLVQETEEQMLVT